MMVGITLLERIENPLRIKDKRMREQLLSLSNTLHTNHGRIEIGIPDQENGAHGRLPCGRPY
jgi:hypothetical protein